MSIVRIGLAETHKFAQGYDAIFGKNKKKTAPTKKAKAKPKGSVVKKKKKMKKK